MLKEMFTYDTIRMLSPAVLILILMEHAQRVGKTKMKPIEVWRLNPYFNGTCSKSTFITTVASNMLWVVLILILMEHAQRAELITMSLFIITGLNPYFNGTCSKRRLAPEFSCTYLGVLILILMEHAQRVLC